MAITQNLSEKDIKFLKGLKSQGVGAEEALSRLQKVKSQSQPTQIPGKLPVMPAKEVKSMLSSGYMPNSKQEYRDLVNKQQFGALESVGNVAKGIFDSTIRPIGDLTNTTVGTTFASGQGVAGALSSLNPFDFKPQEFESRFKKGLTSPTIIGTNPYKADSSGNVDAEQSIRNIVGDTMKGGAGVWNTATLLRGGGMLNKFLPNALSGVAMSAGEDIKNKNDIGSTAFNALLSGALQGTFAKAPDALTGIRKGLGKIAGLSDSSIDLLQAPNLGQKVLSELPSAEAALRDETLNNPLQKVGQEIFKPATSQLAKQNKQLGKQLGDTIKKSAKKTDLSDAYTEFTNQLKKLGGKISKESSKASTEISPYSTFLENVNLKPSKTTSNVKIKFDEFSPIENAKDLKDIQEVLNVLHKYKNKQIPVSKPYELIKKIDARLDYSAKAANPISQPAETALRAARKALSNTVKTRLPESKKLFEQVAKNYQVLDFFNPKLGENASSASVLKNIFSPQRKDELLPMIQRLESQTGKQIVQPTKIAKATMEIAGDPRGDMLLEVGRNPNVRGLLQAIGKKLASPKGTAKGLVREGKNLGLTGILPKGLSSKGAILPTALSKALINVFGTRKNASKN